MPPTCRERRLTPCMTALKVWRNSMFKIILPFTALVGWPSALLAEDSTVVMFFTAPWCTDCGTAPTVTGAKVVEINVDTSPEIARKYNIVHVPTVIVLRNG